MIQSTPTEKVTCKFLSITFFFNDLIENNWQDLMIHYRCNLRCFKWIQHCLTTKVINDYSIKSYTQPSPEFLPPSQKICCRICGKTNHKATSRKMTITSSQGRNCQVCKKAVLFFFPLEMCHTSLFFVKFINVYKAIAQGIKKILLKSKDSHMIRAVSCLSGVKRR